MGLLCFSLQFWEVCFCLQSVFTLSTCVCIPEHIYYVFYLMIAIWALTFRIVVVVVVAYQWSVHFTTFQRCEPTHSITIDLGRAYRMHLFARPHALCFPFVDSLIDDYLIKLPDVIFVYVVASEWFDPEEWEITAEWQNSGPSSSKFVFLNIFSIIVWGICISCNWMDLYLFCIASAMIGIISIRSRKFPTRNDSRPS